MFEFIENDITLKIGFHTIEIMNCHIDVPMDNLPSLSTFNFNVNTEMQINVEHNFLIIVVSVNIYNSDKSLEVGFFKANNVFNVLENFEYIKNKLGKEHVPVSKELATSLNSISISTTRGAMWNSFKGTILHNAILPLWNPNVEISK